MIGRWMGFKVMGKGVRWAERDCWDEEKGPWRVREGGIPLLCIPGSDAGVFLQKLFSVLLLRRRDDCLIRAGVS